ncbi:hypothetical protein, partial [Streptomyces sp. NPDC005091]
MRRKHPDHPSEEPQPHLHPAARPAKRARLRGEAERQAPNLDVIYTHEKEQLSQPLSGENAQKL